MSKNTTQTSIHDTHAHLEMLYQKLNLIPEVRESDIILPDNLQTILNDFSKEYLYKHSWVIHPTVSIENLELVLKLFYDEPKIYFLLGAHPEIVTQDFDLEKYNKSLDSKLELLNSTYPNLIKNTENSANISSRLIGIGEIGLDYFYTQDSDIISTQQNMFRQHIELALKLNLPIEIHTRDAWDDTFMILDEYKEIYGRFLIHCFTGTTNELKRVLDRGGKVAFGGIVTFNKSLDLQDAAINCPMDSFVLETDLPFLAPVPNRGKICLPAMIEDTAAKMAELKNSTPEIIWEWSLKNSLNLFNI